MKLKNTIYSIVVLSLCVGGCGISVPRIGEFWDADDPGLPNRIDDPIAPITSSGQIEFEVKKSIYCQLRAAVAEADRYYYHLKSLPNQNERQLLPDDWGAQISLTFQVDENAGINPGVVLNTPLQNALTTFVGSSAVTTPQSRSIGFGGTLSSTATRLDKYNSYFTVGYLRSLKAIRMICENDNADPFNNEPNKIKPAKSSLLISDLGINRWLIDSLFVDQAIPSYGTPNDPPDMISSTQPAKDKKRSPKKVADGGNLGAQDSISIEIKFIVVTSGSFTPSWKLVRVSADTSNSLLAAGRSRTHDLILTIGPRGTQTDFANLALQIGQSVSSGNRAGAFSTQ